MKTKHPPVVSEPTVSRNAEKGGIEIRFPGNPGEQISQLLRDAGFRFSPFGKSNVKWADPVWYVKEDPAMNHLEWANQLAAYAKATMAQQATQPAARPTPQSSQPVQAAA